jgi:hypothetical protein
MILATTFRQDTLCSPHSHRRKCPSGRADGTIRCLARNIVYLTSQICTASHMYLRPRLLHRVHSLEANSRQQSTAGSGNLSRKNHASSWCDTVHTSYRA